MTYDLLKNLPADISRLPQTLQQSLDALTNDEALSKCFPVKFMDTYLANKRYELKTAEKYASEEIFKRYSRCY